MVFAVKYCFLPMGNYSFINVDKVSSVEDTLSTFVLKLFTVGNGLSTFVLNLLTIGNSFSTNVLKLPTIGNRSFTP